LFWKILRHISAPILKDYRFGASNLELLTAVFFELAVCLGCLLLIYVQGGLLDFW
jgi:hypothetical protein